MTNDQSDPLHQHCLEVAEKALPCNCNDEHLSHHKGYCAVFARPVVAAALEKELRAERERISELES